MPLPRGLSPLPVRLHALALFMHIMVDLHAAAGQEIISWATWRLQPRCCT